MQEYINQVETELMTGERELPPPLDEKTAEEIIDEINEELVETIERLKKTIIILNDLKF